MDPNNIFYNRGPEDKPFLTMRDPGTGLYPRLWNLNNFSNLQMPANGAFKINNMGVIGARTFVTTSSVTKHLLVPPEKRMTTNLHGWGRNGVTLEPVNLFTGELFSSEPIDLNLRGPLPLLFQRYYASKLREDGNIMSALGNNWLHNFDWELTRFGDNFIEVISNRGRLILFEKVNDVWELRGNADIPFQLTESGQAFVLADPRSQLLYTFDSDGKLTKIADGRGNSHTLTYANGQLTQVTDGLERTLTFAYDGSGHLTSVSDGSRTIEFGYSGDNLISFTDAEGKVTSYSYDDANPFPGLLTAKTLPEGNTPFSQTYDENGRVVTQTDAGNNIYTFTYDPSANVTAKINVISFSANETVITDPAGNSSRYVHNDDGEAVSFTDELGQTVALGYDDLGRRNTITDREGRTTTFEFHDPSGYGSAINRADGTTISLNYSGRDVNGVDLYDLISITYPDGGVDNFGYDGAGNLTSFTDPSGATWSMTYNNRGQPRTITNPEGGVTTLTYNSDATLTSLQSPAGNITTFAYDDLKRLTQVTRPDGATRSFTYDDRDRILTVTNENGNTSTLAYDDNGNLTGFTDALGNATTLAYNQQDQIIRATDALGNNVTVSYDELQRVASVTDRNGNTFSFNYDARGRATGLVDAEGNAFAATYDGESAVTSASDPLGNTVTFARDDLSRITGITSALGNQTALTRDIMGRITALQNPLGNATNVSYDNRGLATDITLATGAASNYNRNGFGQITNASDPNGGNWSFQLDNLGRLIGSSDPVGNTANFNYDSRNRPSRVTLPGGLGTLDLGFDGNDNLISLSYSDGTGMNFTYDADNRPTAAEGLALTYDANDAITESNGLSVTRDAGGRIASMTLAPGKIVSYAYDRRNLVTEITDWLGGVTRFSYDAAGRLINMERPNGVSTSFDYNAENRVVMIVESKNENEMMSSISLTRDAFGQITASDRQVPLPPILIAGTITRTFDAASQIEGFDYDGLGRRTSDDQRQYTWDLASRLTGYSENGSAVSFTYDAVGQRLSRTENGTTQSTVWNYAFAGLPQVSVLRENGSDLRYYIHTPGGILLYSVEAGDDSRRFYHFNESGNTLFLTDDAGDIIASYAYSPYGEILNSTGDIDNLFTFQGAFGVMQEGDSGLYYMRARYYDARTGRFISRDPVAFVDPRRINPYQYALGNPMRFTDPSGLTPTGAGSALQTGPPTGLTFVSPRRREVRQLDRRWRAQSFAGSPARPLREESAATGVSFRRELNFLDLYFQTLFVPITFADFIDFIFGTADVSPSQGTSPGVQTDRINAGGTSPARPGDDIGIGADGAVATDRGLAGMSNGRRDGDDGQEDSFKIPETPVQLSKAFILIFAGKLSDPKKEPEIHISTPPLQQDLFKDLPKIDPQDLIDVEDGLEFVTL